MKIGTLVLLLFFLNLQPEDLTGRWIWCKDVYSDGMTLNRNHCPEFIFNKNGTGNLDDYVNFKWRITDKRIELIFESPKVEKEYSLRQTTILNFDNFDKENGISLTLTDSIRKVKLIWHKQK
jgi:hypothetical protein